MTIQTTQAGSNLTNLDGFKVKSVLSFANEEKRNKMLKEIEIIQKSLNWLDVDLRIATKRFNLSDNIKFLAKREKAVVDQTDVNCANHKAKELIGYSILVPTGPKTWYISQIGVMKSLQGVGIGKALMRKIFDEAIKQGINTITLDTDGSDEREMKFFRFFASAQMHIVERDNGNDRFGHPKKKLAYLFLSSLESIKKDSIRQAMISILGIIKLGNDKAETKKEAEATIKKIVEEISLDLLEDKEDIIQSILDNAIVPLSFLKIVFESLDKISISSLADWLSVSKLYTNKIKYRIAILLAQTFEAFPLYIKELGLPKETPEEKAALLEIAKNQTNPFYLYQCLHNYGLDETTVDGQKNLFELAKFKAGQGNSIAWLPKTGIDCETPEGQQSIYEILKILAEKDPERCCLDIGEYGFLQNTEAGQKCLLELARLLSNNKKISISKYIQNFGIKTETPEGLKVAIEIAKKEAEKGTVSKNFKNFGIKTETAEGQKTAIEIARIAVTQECCISVHIHNYQINPHISENQQDLLEIAVLAAQKNLDNFCAYINNYGVDKNTESGQAWLIKLATHLSSLKTPRLAPYINNFSIDPKTQRGQQAIINIAKEEASKGFINIGANDFDINTSTDEGQRAAFEIALMQAEKHPGLLVTHIKEYNIDDNTPSGQEKLIAIAMKASQTSCEAVLRNIRHLRINNKLPAGHNCLIHIAKAAASLCPFELINNLEHVGIDHETEEGQHALIEISKKVSLKYPNQLSINFKKFKINKKIQIGRQGVVDIAKLVAKQDGLDMFRHIQNYETDINSSENKQAWTEVILLALSQIMGPLISDPELLIKEAYAILHLRNPEIRQQLIGLIKNQLVKQPLSTWLALRKDLSNHALLPALFLWALEEEGLKNSRYLAEIIQNKTTKKNYVFKEASSHLALLETLKIFTTNHGNLALPTREKIISTLLACEDKQEMLKAFKILKSLSHLDGINDLKKFEQINDIYTALEKRFFQKLSLPDIPNFFTKFLDTIEKFRNPMAIFNYSSALLSLEEPRLINQFVKFIQDILEKKFPDARYVESEHLQRVFQARPDLVSSWKQGDSINLTDLIETEKSKTSYRPLKINFFNVLTGFFLEGHADTKEFPFLASYLLDKDVEDNEEIKLKIIKKLNQKPIEAQEKKSLQFQNQLIVLSKVDDSKKGYELLEKALIYFPGSESQFKQDLIDLSKSLKDLNVPNEENKYFGWTVVDTDDACDLLLSGTEVEGSCLRIDGSPDNNKCLLSYLIDGKNRMLAIKDENGIIKVRSMFRLLWNQESKAPVLFLERIYPKYFSNKELIEALIKFGRQRADQLNLPLASQELKSSAETVAVPALHSLGGKAFFEYVDASGGCIEGSKWFIKDAHLV